MPACTYMPSSAWSIFSTTTPVTGETTASVRRGVRSRSSVSIWSAVMSQKPSRARDDSTSERALAAIAGYADAPSRAA